jgi:thymidylate kinase
VKGAILAVLDLLERSGVHYCVLHGWEQMGEGSASDLDLAVRPQDLGLVESLLYGWQGAWCVQLLQHESSGYYFVLLVAAAGSAMSPVFLRLDLATDYRRDGRRLLSSAELLSGRRREQRIWVSSPATEFSYLLLKRVLKRDARPVQLQRLRTLAVQLGPQAYVTASRFFGLSLGRRLLSWISRGDWEALQQNLQLLGRRLRRRAVLRDPSSVFDYWPAELRRIWRRWLRPAGLFVAVLGPDGSGKSTLIRELPAVLGGAFRRSDAFHLRPRLLLAGKGEKATEDPHGRFPRSGPASFLKLLYLLLDCSLGYLLRVRPRLACSSLVLFDRYFPDLLADPLRYRHGGPTALTRLVSRLVPRPDLTLVLDVPIERLRERKREVSLAEARRQRAAYRTLAAELPNAVLLDGGRTPPQVTAVAGVAALTTARGRTAPPRAEWFPFSRNAAWSWAGKVLCADEDRPSADRDAGARRRAGALWRLSLPDGRGFAFPLAPPRAAAAALRLYGAQSPAARAAKRGLQAGLTAGLLQPLLPKLARGFGWAACGASLPDHLQDVLGGRDLRFAISLGTPGAHRKPVILVLGPDGRTMACAKIGWNDTTRALVRNEAETLRALEAMKLPGFSAPTLLRLEDWRGRLVCLQSPAPSGAKRAGAELEASYLGALHSLAAVEPRRLPISESPFWESIQQRAGPRPGLGPGSALAALLQRVPGRLKSAELPFCFCHGDFAPWNALQVDRRLFLFDWEYAARHWLPGYDLFHFLLQTRLLLGGQPPLRIFRDVLQQAGRTEQLRSYWRRLGIPERMLCPLLLLYLLERAARAAAENPADHPGWRRILALLELCCAELGWLP